MNAAQWLEILWASDFGSDVVFPGLVGAEKPVMEAVLAEELTFAEITDIATEIIAEASGFSWWWTLNLCATVKETWARLGGAMICAGIDARRMTLGAWCAAAYHTCLTLIGDPKRATEWAFELGRAPEGVVEEVDEEAESAAFLAAMHAPF
jgi:hypothetical protein